MNMAPAFLLVMTLLSVTGALANEKSTCDEVDSSNVTCSQYGCNQQPCSILCEQVSPINRCEQKCNVSTCNSMVCRASINSCLQQCLSGSVCKSLDCTLSGGSCFQTCISGGTCPEMTCSAKDTTLCEQLGGSVMTCHSQECQQTCRSGQKCTMTCSSSVERCNQYCSGAECIYQCAATNCQLDCAGGNCTKATPVDTKAPENSGICTLQMGVSFSVVLGLMLSSVVFM